MKTKFVYQRRSAESVRDRANMTSNNFDRIFKEGIKTYKSKDGKNNIRILPPTWEDAGHYGYDLWVNYRIGADNQSYLSLSKMLNKADPIAEAQQQADKEGDTETAKSLKPKHRIAMWVIDRDNEDEGPLLWACPFTVDKDFANLCFDEDTNEAIMIDDPEEGYDLKFVREGKEMLTNYPASKMRIAREPSPVHIDPKKMSAWLDYIAEHPIPDCLNFYSYDHISAVFNGAAPEKAEEPETKVKQTRPKDVVKEPEPDDEEEEETNPLPDAPVGQSIRERLAARKAPPPPSNESEEDEEEAPAPRRRVGSR